MEIKNYRQLEKFVRENEESDNVEYKASKLLENWNKNEGAKLNFLETFSSYANATGGIVVIGVQQKGKVFSLDEGVELKEFDSVRILDIINGNTSPHISNIKVHLVKKPGSSDRGYYIIEVPEGYTAHQCLVNNKYYGRVGENDMPLRDYQIRLLMFKQRSPVLNLRLQIVERRPETEILPAAIVNIQNVGSIAAKDFVVVIKVTRNLDPYFWPDVYAQFGWRRLIPEVVGDYSTVKITSAYHLDNALQILPGQTVTLKHPDAPCWFAFRSRPVQSITGSVEIEIYCENSPVQIFMTEIKLENLKDGDVIEMDKVSI